MSAASQHNAHDSTPPQVGAEILLILAANLLVVLILLASFVLRARGCQ